VNFKATVIKTGEKIIVYKSKLRNTYINNKDCKTEYSPNELKIHK